MSEQGVGAPAVPRATGHARLRPLPLDVVRLDPAGQLGGWQDLNRAVTLPHCIAHVEERGNLDNLRRLVGRADGDFRGLVFADSDVYKTLEAAGWELHRGAQPALEEFVDTTTRLLADAQDADGYLNSWYQADHPDRKLTEFHWGHEMYCAGHLVQAAVAVARSTGREDLLAVATRFADLLVQRFGAGAQDAVDGHPEIETALVELYRLTGEAAYLRQAERFIELRGRGLLGDDRFGANYFQDHAPVREATEATGHAVRQLYLAAGVTDVYLEQGDATLLTAMERLWDDMYSRKTYVTGAHGSRHRDEAFGDPYELPPDRAYAETCAAIASFQWNWRMLLATGRGRYADEMERVLYNAIASGTSLAGDRFFYSNPLQLRSRARRRRRGHAGRAPGVVPLRLLPAEPRAARRVAERLRGDERWQRPRPSPADRRRGGGRAAGRPRGAEHLDGISVGGDGVDRRHLRARVDACAADPRMVPRRPPDRRGGAGAGGAGRRRLRARAPRVAAGHGACA